MTFDNAIALAVDKFRGIKDKAGQPYILHCVRVAVAQTDETAQQVAVLHDVVEDTDVTLDELARRGFSPQVIAGVDALTHRPDELYQDYVLRLAKSEVARQVKLADLNDNYRLDRVKYTLENQENDGRRIQKYILTYQFLTGLLTQVEYLSGMEKL